MMVVLSRYGKLRRGKDFWKRECVLDLMIRGGGEGKILFNAKLDGLSMEKNTLVFVQQPPPPQYL